MKGEKNFSSRFGPDHCQVRSRLNIVIAYDQPDAARYALKLLDRLLARFRHQVEIHRDLWNFDHFSLAEVRTRAAQANLAVVCTDPSQNLPLPVKRWLQTWCQNRVAGTAAVAALMTRATPPQGPSYALDFLSQITSHARQDFFVATLPLRHLPSMGNQVERQPWSETSSTACPNPSTQHAFKSSWSLNE